MSNLTWHDHTITKEERQQLKQHKSVVLWFTGLSGAGKSTVANAVEKLLYERRVHTYLLDGDNVRLGLNADLKFSEDDRKENIRRIGEVAKLFVDGGVIAITAFISPFRADRDLVREKLPEGEFIEVHIDCPLDVCETRDPKGLYKKARAGQIPDFTGISSPYEAPLNPELTVTTGTQSIEESAAQVVRFLEEKGIIAREA